MPLLTLLTLQASPDIAALDRLRRAEALLAAAPSLRAGFVRDDLGGGDYTDLRQTGRVEASRSGGVYVHIDRARRVREGEPWRDTGNSTLLVGDGKEGHDVFFHAHSLQARPAKPTLAGVPPLAAFLGGAGPAEAFAKAQADGSLRDVSLGKEGLDFAGSAGRVHVEFDEAGRLRRYVLTTPRGRVQDWRVEGLTLGAAPTKGIFAYRPPANALPYERGGGAEAPEVGQVAPDFALADLKGNSLRLSDLRGKAVVLEFFATWCWPCNQALPFIDRTVDGVGSKDVVRVAVAIRAGRKDLDAWTKGHPKLAGFRFLYEDPRTPTASTLYGVSTTPSSYVIGRDGRIVSETAGFKGPTPELRASVERALAE